MNRAEIAKQLLSSLANSRDKLATEFSTPGRVGTFILDDALDPALAAEIFKAFPPTADMLRQQSFREDKYVAVQMNRYRPILEEVLCAFHDERVVKVVSEITSLPALAPDPTLTRGGISVMTKGNFLGTHLDNSHDREQRLYRVLNLLYYVSPDWRPEFGGALELWDHGVKHPPRSIEAKFNRLVVMVTNQSSWHSVSKFVTNAARTCVSNYYYSPHHATVGAGDYHHVTSFRGRPNEPLRDAYLRLDGIARNFLRRLFTAGVRQPHSYNK